MQSAQKYDTSPRCANTLRTEFEMHKREALKLKSKHKNLIRVFVISQKMYKICKFRTFTQHSPCFSLWLTQHYCCVNVKSDSNLTALPLILAGRGKNVRFLVLLRNKGCVTLLLLCC